MFVRITTFCLIFLFLICGTSGSLYAMHITEGILPPKWVGIWFAFSMPFVGYGVYSVKLKKKKFLNCHLMQEFQLIQCWQ